MLFKSDTMNALVACDLLDEGYDLHETLERMDSFSFLLEEGRSGELYKLVLWEGDGRLDEKARWKKEAEGAEASGDATNGRQFRQAAATAKAAPEDTMKDKKPGEVKQESEKRTGAAAKDRVRELEKTARGSDARKKTAERITGMRKTISGMKDKAKEKGEAEGGQGGQGEGGQGEGGQGEGGRGGEEKVSLRQKIKDTGDHLEKEDLEHESGAQRRGGTTTTTATANGGSGRGGGGGRQPDTKAVDKSDPEPQGERESGADAEHRREQEKAEGEHRRGMEKTEHDRKQTGKGKWGETIRKGLAGAGSLVKKGLEGAGNLVGGAAKGVGKALAGMDRKRQSRYAAQTKDRSAEGEHKREMERGGRQEKHARGMKTAKEGETSAERTARDAQAGDTKRTQSAQTGETMRAGISKMRRVTKISQGGGKDKSSSSGGSAIDKFKASQAAKRDQQGVERNVRRTRRSLGRTVDSYSPQENSPELGMMSEHLKVDQSGKQDTWQNLMEGVVSKKRAVILEESKKKSLRKREN